MKRLGVFFATLTLFSGMAFIADAAPTTKIIIQSESKDLIVNPTLNFRGISGNQAFSDAMKSLLTATGWFTMKNGENTDFVVSGSGSDGTFIVTLEFGNSQLLRQQVKIAPGKERVAAKMLVDMILKKCFPDYDLDGLCKSKIVFCAETAPNERNLYMCDIDGQELTQLSHFKSLVVEPAWFPTGKTIAFTKYNRTTTDILELDVNSKKARRLASYPGLNVGAAISPNGKNLALILSLDNQVELYVKAVNSATKKRLTNGQAVEASPVWNKEGNMICFVSDEGGRTPKLWVINANGTGRQKLPTIGTEATSPDWSGDNKIVYSARVPSGYTIAVLGLNSETQKFSGDVFSRGKGNPGGGWESPSWSPDNRHVVCCRIVNGKSSLWVVDTFTGAARPLLNVARNLSMPSWSPLMK